MIVDRVVVGVYETNCYILTLNDEVLVIDPGDEFNKIKPYLEGKKIAGVLITHSHSDHIGALGNFDKNIIYDFRRLKASSYQIGAFEFEVIYTPGHTDDSLTFYFVNDGIMFTGDFLFKGTIGRTDFHTGSKTVMRSSLKKISKFPNVLIYPGHGKSTSLDKERQNNIYFSKI